MTMAAVEAGRSTTSCRPLYWPRRTSATTRSGTGGVHSSRRPSSKLLATRVSYPAPARIARRASKTAGSSSTTRTRDDTSRIVALARARTPGILPDFVCRLLLGTDARQLLRRSVPAEHHDREDQEDQADPRVEEEGHQEQDEEDRGHAGLHRKMCSVRTGGIRAGFRATVCCSAQPRHQPCRRRRRNYGLGIGTRC